MWKTEFPSVAILLRGTPDRKTNIEMCKVAQQCSAEGELNQLWYGAWKRRMRVVWG